MAESRLTQAEADTLIQMEKHRADDARSVFPMGGRSLTVALNSPDRHEQFFLDVSRGSIRLEKVKMQTRARQVVILARVDLAGAPHRNPDGAEVPCPHLHQYREGFGDKYAVPLPAGRFTNPADVWVTLTQFMTWCNITQPPHIERGLFT